MVEMVYITPGNGGTEFLPRCQNVKQINPQDYVALAFWAQGKGINLVVPSCEEPLVAGIESAFRTLGIPFFGPTKESAQLEGSKAFFHSFTKRYQIPTPRAEIFTRYEDAAAYLRTDRGRMVIKAVGLSASKGVVIATDNVSAQLVLKDFMVDMCWGDAGGSVILEEFVSGFEFSIMAMSDGNNFRTISTVRDYKSLLDGDEGPNTGGMGSHAPVLISSSLLTRVEDTIIRPLIEGMQREGLKTSILLFFKFQLIRTGTPFRGVLNIGIICTNDGPLAIDFDVRFGDPETQAILPLLVTDLALLTLACVEGHLDTVEVEFADLHCVAVVMCAQGYPAAGHTGDKIQVIDSQSGE
ncbi:hypothetical protein ONS96_004772 [Cadophora gregata f. sp. sojae]|nr:hypothetical protein ONS96_004772 [Cadophora gregata f. sp. sojae]